ncbi:NUDIX hydrolase [Paenibacillus sp. Cedars]|uniref:NUDIX hydrolase n=1 Tax=Paenibacillus sp. Cedars TaxID=1980674 RepID=UPI0011649CFB|nr:NUDIX hydrolase [Paenibacillus sp. Cedars]AWP30755.1 DNA mismatch repair protein MutT [Paenibacillus sp. Cedars]
MGYVEELRAAVGTRPLIFVGSVVLIKNNCNQVLLQKRKYPAGSWAIPGGLMELGESVEETAKREIKEETNLSIDNLQLINVYSGRDNYIKQPNGDEFYVVVNAFYTEHFVGEMIINRSESLDFEFIDINDIPDNLAKSHRPIISDFINKFMTK